MYSELLQNLGASFEPLYPWLNVGKTSRIQGWKLHLSTIQTEAKQLLDRTVPILVDKGICFKIARDETVLTLLNEGSFGPTQVGKFMTIFPVSDDEAKELAKILIKVTMNFHGPVIVTDLRLGKVVYARYGSFNPIVQYNRYGQKFKFIYGCNGLLQKDEYSCPLILPKGVLNPFASFPPYVDLKDEYDYKSNKVLGPGYLLVDVIKAHTKGNIYTALDIRSREKLSIKVIKEGRQFCLSDEYGRDIRARLRYQEILHRMLADTVSIPKADPYFEEGGNGYLPLEYIDGNSFEYVSKYLWNTLSLESKIGRLNQFIDLIDNLSKLHSKNYVHRDLTASNIWISKNGKVFLIDLELVHKVGSINPPFLAGTPGFMSPQQAMTKSPSISDDIYSLGSVMILLFTGVDPRRIITGTERNMLNNLFGLIKFMPSDLIKTIAKCLRSDPKERPNLKEIRKIINAAIDYLYDVQGRVSRSGCTDDVPRKLPVHKIRQMIEKGHRGLHFDAIHDENTNMWLSRISTGHFLHHDMYCNYMAHKSIYKGASGALYLLGLLAKVGYNVSIHQDHIIKTINWLTNESESFENNLAGLYFGRTGIAVALSECISGSLIKRTSQIEKYILKSLTLKPQWYDLMHGAAGQGLGVIYCSERLNEDSLLRLSHQYADFLIKHQEKDGSWKNQSDMDGSVEDTLTGFAHGVAGIIYFLIEYKRIFKDNKTETSIEKALDWLIKTSHIANDGLSLEWYHSINNKKSSKWWCHGSPGISLVFLKLFELTNDKKYAVIASKCLAEQADTIGSSDLSQCHGLSGLGEIYLEAARLLQENKWYNTAYRLAETIISLNKKTTHGSIYWLVHDPYFPTADLMVGNSGIIHFFLKLSLNDKIGLPMLPDPIR